MPSPYVVDLVSSGKVSSASSGSREAAREQPKETAPDIETKIVEKDKMHDSKINEKLVEDRIREFKAKERIRRNQDLKNKLASIQPNIKQQSTTKSGQVKKSPGSGSGQPGQMKYGDRVGNEIRMNYECVPGLEQSLEVKINIKVQKDGTISLGDIGKKSGNRLFDRCALQAIQRTAKVTPPQLGDDSDIQVTFRP